MIHVLEDLPWGFKHPEIQYWKNEKVHVYKGTFLPDELHPFASKDFSYARWKEDELNGVVQTPEKSANRFSLREHQAEGVKYIVQHYIQGSSDFLLADKTGIGKTLTGLASIALCAKQAGFSTSMKAKVLIVCPKTARAQWRNTIQSYPLATGFCRFMIINYQQLNKLLEAPPKARVAKKRSTKNRQTAREGKPLINWDFVIFDESQYLKNYGKSAVSMSAANVAQLNNTYIKGKTPYVLFSTATPGSTPLHMAVLARMLAPLITNNGKATPNTWGKFLKENGFNVDLGKSGWVWKEPFSMNKNSCDASKKAQYEYEKLKNDQAKKRDTRKIGLALKKKNAPFLMRAPKDIEGWPDQVPVKVPIEMNATQIAVYQKEWSEFRRFLLLPAAKRNPQTALVKRKRYRQKSSLLKVDSMVDFVMDRLDVGEQVYISCEFMDTIDRYRELLEKNNVKVAEITGRYTGSERENQRLMFQKGEAKVVLCSIVEAISLHAGESLSDGTKATDNTRATIIHDIREDPNRAVQSFGRAHREGQNSICYFPYLDKTVDVKILDSFINKDGNMKAMTGEEENTIERVFKEASARTTPPKEYS